MIQSQKIKRRLFLEQLAERIVFDVEQLLHDESLRFTTDGLAYYYDPPAEFLVDEMHSHGTTDEVHSYDEHPFETSDPLPISNLDSGQSALAGPAPDQDGTGGALPTDLTVPVYHSNPSFPKKLYLDFDGHVATGTSWNNRNFTGTYNTGATITAPAYSADADRSTFSASELTQIQEVWARVAEDYAPFQLDVTTEAPPASLFTAGSQAMRIVITTDVDAVTNTQWYPAAGGVAFLNSWNFTNASPAWVFANRLSNFAKYMAEAVSHEGGHTFGLSHDGRVSPAEGYYQGHGGGSTGWAPIMGVGYYRSLSQWSRGEYTSANNLEDDLTIMANKLSFVADDHGDTIAAATLLNVGTASTIAATGLISTRSDLDAIRFATQAGSITLNVATFDDATGKNNLDAKLTLLDRNGTTVATVDNVNTVNSTLTINVAKGYYTLVVDGAARPGEGADEGYSDYGSLGKYSISGSIVPNAAPTVVNDTATVVPLGSVLLDVLANDSDANNDTLSILSIGSPAVGTAVIEAGKIRYNAGSARGLVTIPYTVVDELGVSTTGSVSVTVNTQPADINLSSSSVSENLDGGNIGNVTVSDADAGDVHVLTVDDSRFEVANGILKLKPGVKLDYEGATTVTLNITATDAANAQFTKSFTISVVDLPELAISGGIVIDDGTAQRSTVRSVTVTFDGAVTLLPGAFTVVKRGGGSVTTSAVPSINGNGQTVVVLTFSGEYLRGVGSALVDGYYQLTIDGTKVTRASQQLDTNGDGQGGDSHVFGALEADNFFARYADTNGDGLVGIVEFSQFRTAFGKLKGDVGFDERFDYEGDDAVGITDFSQFRTRFGQNKMIF